MIIALSGKKQSGKSSACNYILGQYLLDTGKIEKFFVNENGDLAIEDEIELPNPFINFTDELKAFCISTLGLSEEQVYGSEEDKNTYTQYSWENFPQFTQNEALGIVGALDLSKSGPMTAREVMQVVGASLRKANSNIWVDSCVRRITNNKSDLVLISDCRYPNEVEAIHKLGGIVIRLTLNRFNDQAESEIALDNYQFDYIIDNQNLNIHEKNQAIFSLLKSLIK